MLDEAARQQRTADNIMTEGDNPPDGRLWEQYVRGEITEVVMPCRHTDLMT
ncbi:hypothetical protein [Streptomyces sp. NPDC091371]|uniref:hypothetical protein n=1 Tax=Streptomyces sp. NPDC091371 TaxID=3155303 RepID=UPI00341D6C8B